MWNQFPVRRFVQVTQELLATGHSRGEVQLRCRRSLRQVSVPERALVLWLCLDNFGREHRTT